MFKKRAAFEVLGGQNRFKKSAGNIYRMVSQKEEGVVNIKGKLYFLLGVHKEEKHSRSAGKAAAGAIVGGVLTGGLGAIAGGAIGGRKKDDSVYFLDFADYETMQEFTVQVKHIKNTTPLINFIIADID